jgi:hypothetical protein
MISKKPIFQPGYFEELRRTTVIIPATPEQLAAQKTAIEQRKLGLGDHAHQVLGPIGRAIGWPCMKGVGSTDLKPGSPCDKARTFLNDLSK